MTHILFLCLFSRCNLNVLPCIFWFLAAHRTVNFRGHPVSLNPDSRLCLFCTPNEDTRNVGIHYWVTFVIVPADCSWPSPPYWWSAASSLSWDSWRMWATGRFLSWRKGISQSQVQKIPCFFGFNCICLCKCICLDLGRENLARSKCSVLAQEKLDPLNWNDDFGWRRVHVHDELRGKLQISEMLW